MNQRDTAKLIPAIIRKYRLITDADPIMNSFATTSNGNMMLLAEIWYSYIEPGKEKVYCPICLNNIKNNFLALRPHLIELENESLLLNSL